jgi:hypothetical protein
MKRLIARLVLAVALVAPGAALLTAPAAHAGWYSYTPSVCRSSLWVQDRQGAADFEYWPWWQSFPDIHTVWSQALVAYWRYNGSGPARECGWLNRPIDDGAWSWDNNSGQNIWVQRFAGGELVYFQVWNEWRACAPNGYWCYFVMNN